MSSPKYSKLQVVRKVNSFTEATAIVPFPLVAPAADEIRVRVIYTGVNMTDVNICAGRFFVDAEPPYDIGFESIGLVDAIGSDVPEGKYHLNQPVLVADTQRFDAFSEVLYKQPKFVVPLPDLKPDYLVSYGSGLTAAIGIDLAGRVKPGDKVLVVAAAGGTGQIAAQWAKHRGGYVIGTTSSEEKEAFLKQIGVDCVINYKKQNLGEVLKEKFPEGIDVIWETIGGESLKQLFYHLANRGRLAVVGSTYSYADEGFAKVEIDDWNVQIFMGNKSLTGFALFEYLELFDEYLAQLISMIADGKMVAAVDLGEKSEGGKFFGLVDIARAEEYLQKGKNIGKVIVKVQEP